MSARSRRASGLAACDVVRAVDLDDESNRGRKEVDDVSLEQRHLSLERDAKLSAPQL
jgi:hypothetical protein